MHVCTHHRHTDKHEHTQTNTQTHTKQVIFQWNYLTVPQSELFSVLVMPFEWTRKYIIDRSYLVRRMEQKLFIFKFYFLICLAHSSPKNQKVILEQFVYVCLFLKLFKHDFSFSLIDTIMSLSFLPDPRRELFTCVNKEH